MAEQILDLSDAEQPKGYSQRTHNVAMLALSKGMVVHVPGTRTARCQSLTAPKIWEPAASLNSGGEVIGVTCNCPNGTKGGLRARCWHAAALEHLLDESRERLATISEGKS